MRPVSPRFIACTRSPDEAQVVFFGIPFEGTVNLRKGADRGPLDLRLASDSIETYSPALGRDLEDLAMADLGDCELPDAPPRAQLEAAREEIRRFWRPGLRSVMLGGDHTATLPVIEVLAAAVPGLRILHFDAHPDTREEFLGERFCYASAMARVMEVVPPERVFQVGMRTGSREEFERRLPNFFPVTAIAPGDAVRGILPELRRHPLYVTIDMTSWTRPRLPAPARPSPAASGCQRSSSSSGSSRAATWWGRTWWRWPTPTILPGEPGLPAPGSSGKPS